ncbi:phospholipid carrier-dependent glycosyltransferase [Terriglobus saanensis]|uniref:Glycosyl transferase family 39 n=1 Tax=Terriglobus saanensis (strain ATCC BAA-1853 / DSM 23119 / SP1PR4) TaxID=401053 RepID=E8V676_TERSS|nr:phospholipid carrier-dependent glycosyltransferase [Terriglobus saanensis]ADV84967.1 glycosyl transferase family 39 [Terriglobus saanensis SP1PR4]
MTIENPEELSESTRTTKAGLAAAIVLVLIFFAQCVSTARRDSVSWDESQHLYSGWLSWKQADFGFNPEVPPLVKMWCAIPLLHRNMTQPPYIGGSFKKEGFVLGQRFLAANGIDPTLIPARLMAALLSALLAITIFLAALEMYGQTAALLALALFCFDPNFLAHGAFVTTDVGASFTLLLSTYLFYRVLKAPSALRVIWLGIAVGMTLTAKFTGIFVLPMIVVVSLLDLWNRRAAHVRKHREASGPQLTMVVASISAMGLFFIWAIYRFRFAARPANLALDPVTNQYLQELSSPLSRSMLLWVANHHLLPEAYLYGLADTKISAASLPSYLFGHLTHQASRWYYPAALTIKSTLPFLLLLLVTIVALASRRWQIRREAIVLMVPPAVLFVLASTSDIGIGFRHLLPIFPMLYILIAGCATHLVHRNRNLAYVLGALLLWQIGTSELSRPGLVAYANEAWGGPAMTHLYLTDSNTDWGQQLRYVKTYLDQHPNEPCYFAYFEQGPVDFRDYGVRCQVLPTGSGTWTGMTSMHFGSNPSVSGLVLVSDGVLAGADIPGKTNPYATFQTLRPDAVIDRAVYVYKGQFKLGPAAALEHVEGSGIFLTQGRTQEALVDAELATRLDPESATAWEAKGDALAAMGRRAEAHIAYQIALEAPELDPVFEQELVRALRRKAGA